MNQKSIRDTEISKKFKQANYAPPARAFRSSSPPDEMTSAENECYWRSLLDDFHLQKPESRQQFLPGFLVDK